MFLKFERVFAWIFGLGILAIVIKIASETNPDFLLEFFSLSIFTLWLCITLAVRFLMVEIFVRPIHALGYMMDRWGAFWLGWLRSFFNQILPLSGVVLAASYVRHKSGLTWGQVASLISPQFLLIFTITGFFSGLAIFLNREIIGTASWPLIIVTLILTSFALFIRSQWMNALFFYLPQRFLHRLESMRIALAHFTHNQRLVVILTVCHCAGLILRGLRLWLLFTLAAQFDIKFTDLILLIAISELGFLIQLTPGGIGIREGAMLSAAWLLGLDLDVVAGVAVADRIFSIFVIVIMALPAFYFVKIDLKKVIK